MILVFRLKGNSKTYKHKILDTRLRFDFFKNVSKIEAYKIDVNSDGFWLNLKNCDFYQTIES